MRQMINDAQGALLRSLRRFFDIETNYACSMIVVEGASSEPWASATFSGQRHCVEVRAEGISCDRIDRMIVALTDAELVMPGHIVADIALVEHRMHDEDGCEVHHLVLEALTVSD